MGPTAPLVVACERREQSPAGKGPAELGSMARQAAELLWVGRPAPAQNLWPEGRPAACLPSGGKAPRPLPTSVAPGARTVAAALAGGAVRPLGDQAFL